MSEDFVEEPLEDSGEYVGPQDDEAVEDGGNNSNSLEEVSRDDDATTRGNENDAGGGASGSGEQGDHAEYPEQMDSKDKESRNRTEELTRRYLNLLAMGKLASKKKQENMEQLGARAIEKESRAQARVQSVHERELQRLHATTSAMGVRPLGRREGSMSARKPSTAPHTGYDTQTMNRLTRSASEPSSPFTKRYTPGPGAYHAKTDRFGSREGLSTTFGKERQRPHHVCVFDNVVSPGPIYQVSEAHLSYKQATPTISFPKREVGSRFSLSENQPSNCPHWNPGPGDYTATTLHTGKSAQTGPNAPNWRFSKSNKLISPEANMSGTVYLSEAHCMVENVNVHSPGPARYEPKNTATKENSTSKTISYKAASHFDQYSDPARQTSPGPVYDTRLIDKRGGKTFISNPKTVFGKGPKIWSPETSLSATPFVTYEHAYRANQSLHGPGPKYYPAVETKSSSLRVSGTNIGSGQGDRFYSRFEPGRVT